ncbi:MIP transporter [Amniculicola lignicola CBS 123094]|uniref:MIP transporter n=1 Tax=Amniculicola lignicola CBS 123094 TaxID=1392246 RepID=A0A6A5WMQ7_9PLEO|nr:MIP transporter [Amniculicola lignicola CBS 123094]
MAVEQDIELATQARSKDLEYPDVRSSHEHELRYRKKRDQRYDHGAPELHTRPFVGRMGGNQEYTMDPDDASFVSIISKVPDAGTTFTWRQSIKLDAFSDLELWKEATIEGVGGCLQFYLAGLYSIGLASKVDATALGAVTPAILGALSNWILIALFIYAGGPVSGGHFNPLITMSTFFARLSILPRTVLYVLFQCTGSVVAGFMLRASLGEGPKPFETVPGCYIDTSLVTPGQAYALETMSCFALLFIAFGVGLDPRQRQVFGPALSPILVGLALGLCTFGSSIFRPGYAGASMNPARCLGLMAVAGKFDYHYIHWVGPITAGALNGMLYWAIPIYKD